MFVYVIYGLLPEMTDDDDDDTDDEYFSSSCWSRKRTTECENNTRRCSGQCCRQITAVGELLDRGGAAVAFYFFHKAKRTSMWLMGLPEAHSLVLARQRFFSAEYNETRTSAAVTTL